MEWIRLKARMLEAGSVRLTGEPASQFISRSAAGPSAGSAGSLFFSVGSRRVRVDIDSASPIEVVHRGGGEADLAIDGDHGRLYLYSHSSGAASFGILLRARPFRTAERR